jgi:hypothetical protein
MKQLTPEEYQRVTKYLKIGQLKEDVKNIRRLISYGVFESESLREMRELLDSKELELTAYSLEGDFEDE